MENGLVVARREIHNLITTAGKNHALDVVFGNASPVAQVDPWYFGLINNTPSPVLLAADTLASHTGWAELEPGTDYTGNRQEWDDADAASGAKATTSVATFPILTSKTVYGAFLASVASGTSGILMSEGAFTVSDVAVPLPVVNGQDLKVSVSFSI